MNKEEKLKISKMLRERDIDNKLEIYLSPDLYCYVHNYIVDLKMKITQLTNNWNELRQHIKEYLEEWENSDDEWVKGKCDMARDILYDMEEINGSDKE